MKHVSGIKKTVLAASVAATMAAGLAAPSIAVAEISGTAGVSNMYFWRGVDPVSYTHLTLPTSDLV